MANHMSENKTRILDRKEMKKNFPLLKICILHWSSKANALQYLVT